MFDFLPPAEVLPLAGSPLTQVVAQVKMNAQSTFATHSGVGVLHDALTDYPRLLAEQQAVFTASPAGVTTTQIPQWRMTDLDGDWSVIVSPEQLAIETKAYDTWESFRARLAAAVEALGAATSPRVQERIGLRYINQIPPGDGGSYSGRVRADLLGPANGHGWRSKLEASLSQALLADDGTYLALRYGTGRPVVEADAFVLDIDCYDERPRTFDGDEIVSAFDSLNDVAYRCFAYCVSDDFRASLKLGV